ncbi:RNA-guided endonuclease InsQ/TnpB family protein [Companilactobacillus mishanensis]|uniref:IS200/IS605 family element transposase accessory protein TnpB n=1 Tax=Companilactobacillus mishanensis TaxID=2486008 RepID=A0A5P0ZGE8_9LACO|nr:RNA-guided endonuclease TnpB family protein [Companilactobacillus mishanensis]MQS52102.1 IS200/IS605 family element transposase accessory protein TnpB [Companilactobacillus mishanensis]
MNDYQYHYGVKVRCYPSDKQKQIIEHNLNGSRFAYNEMVAIDKELYQLRKCKLYIKQVQDRIDYLTERKESTKYLFGLRSWLNKFNVGTDVTSMAIRNYKAAWNLFMKVHTTGIPKFHKKQHSGGFQLPNRYSSKVTTPSLFNGNIRFLDNKRINISLIGRIRVSGSYKRVMVEHADIRIGTVTVSKDAVGNYYISLQLASDSPFVRSGKSTGDSIGIDLNTENFLTTSNGDVVENPRYYRKNKKRLAKQQRILSRKQLRAKKEHRRLLDSKNYQKQRVIVAQLHNEVCNRRTNFLHDTSTALIKNHDLVVVEELRSKNLLKNHALAMSISDVGWRTFLQMLEYKAEMYDKVFIAVDPKYTTQTCSNCGYVMKGKERLTLSDRTWTCPDCTQYHIRDHNAAKNILAKAM